MLLRFVKRPTRSILTVSRIGLSCPFCDADLGVSPVEMQRRFRRGGYCSNITGGPLTRFA